MAKAVPMPATAVEGLMGNIENIPPCSKGEEKPFESNLSVKQAHMFKPSPKPRGRSAKARARSPSAMNGKKQDSSSHARGRPKKTDVVGSLTTSDAKKLDFSPLKSCQSFEKTPKSGKPASSNLNSFFVKSNSCVESAEFKEQPAVKTDDIVIASLSPNDLKASGSNESKPKDMESETPTPSLKKSLKRKRSLFLETLDSQSRATHMRQFRQEIESLFKYFNESFEKIGSSGNEEVVEMGNVPTNVIIARLLEDSRLPYSKLVEQIHEKLKNKLDQNGVEISLAFVKSSVLFIGQRPSYGIPSTQADVLEDDTESCLWCWEVRDLKLLPKSQRDFASIRRRCRKKIHERITALSAMLSALSSLESEEMKNVDLARAEELLMKADDEISIRAMVADLLQKSVAQIMAKQAKQKEKEAIKEKERNNKKSEKEQKRLDRELRKEKIQQEKEQARAQKEAIIHEKETKRQQEEAEKEQKRREKEEAETKKQLALQKQATIMGRFLQSKRETPKAQNVEETSHNPLKENVMVSGGVMMLMDQTLWQKREIQTEDLLRSHLEAWHDVNHHIFTKRNLNWGKRRKPKVALFNELRLQQAPSEAVMSVKLQPFSSKKWIANDTECREFKAAKNAVNDWEEEALCDSLPDSNGTIDINRESMLHNKKRKLLQFDKTNRPAYYGTFSKKSGVVGPRHPFGKDPSLDYDIDSDEEWEEEDPGESLSDDDKDDEEEKIEAEKEKLNTEEDDDGEDGFVVPDGYLSENEGACSDDESDMEEDQLKNTLSQNSGKSQQLETESEWHIFERQQKVLEKVTDRALQSGHAFIVNNLQKDRNSLKTESGSSELTPRERLEQTCLQALRVQICSPDITIELPSGPPTEASTQDDQEPPKHQKKSSALPDADLPALVSIIQASNQGMNKIVESLLTKFPNISKKHLKTKIREIADFAENRWQVKKEVLEKLGMLPNSVQASEVTETAIRQQKGVVAKSPTQVKGIATYFSKRCFSPEAAGINNIQSSPDNGNFEKQRDKASNVVHKREADVV